MEESHEWEKFLHLVLYAYRATKHAPTGITPFELMYDRDPPNMIHLGRTAEYDPSSYDLFLRKKLAEFRDFVECQMVESQKRQKYHYDSKSKSGDLQFAIGDPVSRYLMVGCLES